MTTHNAKQNYEKDFNLNDELIHLNHAAVAPWPLVTQQAVQEFATENTRIGSVNYLQWMQHEENLRQQLKLLINADSTSEIALLKSTSEALSVVAYGIDWQPGDSVVSAAEEFPSNRLLWQSLQRFGVDVRLVDYLPEDDAEQCIIDACDESTRLVSISAVQYGSGRRTNLLKIGDFCEQQNILFCIDAIQQLGALSFDVNKVKADFVAADGHKWMLGAEGLALFYCRKKHLQTLKLNQYGWHMVENMHDFNSNEWTPADSARRFECGSPNMLGIMALEASLKLIHSIGMKTIEDQVLANTRYLLQQFSAMPELEILSPQATAQQSGIVVVRHRKKSNEELFEYLKQHHVLCAPRGGGIRFSAHYYTPATKLEQLVSLLDT
ncbi:MAG: aminotransferase class V-fold PLP-dependent enzyme [Gammaproteobacteria bacterium]|nr:aminotransferase class V-fold PLP-dependent enzyme [Gammaproteobacteria bacterium]